MSNKAPKEIFVDGYGIISNEPYDELLIAKSPIARQTKYLSEEHFNSLIEKWKDEEKIWKEQLAEKDKEIKALKHKLQLYNNKHRPLK